MYKSDYQAELSSILKHKLRVSPVPKYSVDQKAFIVPKPEEIFVILQLSFDQMAHFHYQRREHFAKAPPPEIVAPSLNVLLPVKKEVAKDDKENDENGGQEFEMVPVVEKPKE